MTNPSNSFANDGTPSPVIQSHVTPSAVTTSHVVQWLVRFDRALAAGDRTALASLFVDDCHWRDVLALTWRIDTLSGAEAVIPALLAHARRMQATGFALAIKRTAPREVLRAGAQTIEAFVTFNTKDGRCDGVLRLMPDQNGTLKAWVLMTALDALRTDAQTERKTTESRDFRGPNWLDQREQALLYDGRDPDVIVVGCGQAGLAAAAHLTSLGVDTLIVDRSARIGDNWRKRYHALRLHNQTHVNHMPFMPFPSTWPTYIPKDKLAGWFEAYAEAMELNVWTETEFEGGNYDDAANLWRVTLRRADGTQRVMRPRHIVMATGVSGIPNIPEIATLSNFDGEVMHSSVYRNGHAWSGKSVMVLGTGTSGHDIAQDLQACSAQVTIVQRSPTLITQIEPSAQLAYALYGEGTPTEDCDLITVATPTVLGRKTHIALTQKSRELDKDLLDGLERVGFRLDYGENNTGWQFKYHTRGGGYYFNVGASDLIASGAIRLVQYADIDGFVGAGAKLRDGSVVTADLIVLATGYKSQETLVRKLYGDDVMARVGPIWGFGDGVELRNMFTRTKQPGLWFIAGSLAQCRIYSKYLALQIKACETGLIGMEVGAQTSDAQCAPPIHDRVSV